jgi:HAD superfamily hydrolase (TIGR01509 family)
MHQGRPAAVVFDLDGVLVDSEQLWDQARRELVDELGSGWTDSATTDMLGMSSREWPGYVREQLGVDLPDQEISDRVVARIDALYREALPLLPGAVEAVRRMAAHGPVGLATSSNREIIDLFVELTGLADAFGAMVSSEEVAAGKPAPDVYLEAARRLGVAPADSLAVEDSTNGIKAAHAAGMTVAAIPNPHFPPDPDALALADRRLSSLDDLR